MQAISGLRGQAGLPVWDIGFRGDQGSAPVRLRRHLVVPVLFGDREDVKAFRDVFSRKSLTKYGPPIAIEEKYDQLPPLMKRLVDNILENNRVTQADVARYYAQGRMDLFEECGDIVFEYEMYEALARKVIGGRQIRSWIPELLALKEQGRPFEDIRDFVRGHISQVQYDKFHKLTGLKDPGLSEALFVISCLKPAQFSMRGQDDVLIQDARERLKNEAAEMVDALSHRPLLQKFMRFYLRLVPVLQPVLGKYVMSVPVRVVRWVTRLPALEKEDLIRFIIIKQTGRQELDYISRLQYNERKQVLKPFEALAEADIIRQLEGQSYKSRRASSAV